MQVGRVEVAQTVLVGVGATAVMDVVGEVLRRTRGVQPLDYALVGRWIGRMPAGEFRHESITAAPPVPHEKALGWAAHYSIGVAFAGLLVALDPGWLDRPRLAPALAVGVGTVAAPWFLMQPALGLGVAASRTPDPLLARARSLRTHAVYGAGLWPSGRLVRGLSRR